MPLTFHLRGADGDARLGQLETPHGSVETPAFMPVGTLGAVKGLGPQDLEAAGASILLANLYHLTLRPGIETIERLGGLHAFTGWRRPILTDSGGYQVMSLAGLRQVDDGGVTFRSHLDGSLARFTPEGVVEAQGRLGVDVAMVLDECPPWPVTREEAAGSLARTLAWARRSREARDREVGPGAAGLFGIVQGSVYRDLRERGAAALVELGFDGYAIGGVSVGESVDHRRRAVEWTAPALPADKPRYLMGVGKPADLVGAVGRGIDMFDCVLPTRSGRTGQAFTKGGPVNLRNARHAEDARPLEAGCRCPACAGYSRAYLHHLVKAGEILGAMLLTWHNLHHYQALMANLRRAIQGGRLAEFRAGFDANRAAGDLPPL